MKARFVHAWERFIWRSCVAIWIIWEVVILTMTAAAAADVLGPFDWGYETRDIWGGLMMSLLGVGALAFFWVIHRIMERLNAFIYGPDSHLPPQVR